MIQQKWLPIHFWIVFFSMAFTSTGVLAGTSLSPLVREDTAQDLLNSALAQAKTEGKMVFIRFGTTGCPHCVRMDKILARPQLKAAFDSEFVDLKINITVVPQAKPLYKTYAKLDYISVPWFAFLDSNGAVLANSVAASGNIGCPELPEEIRFFMDMLTKHAKSLTTEQLAQIEAAFKKT